MTIQQVKSSYLNSPKYHNSICLSLKNDYNATTNNCRYVIIFNMRSYAFVLPSPFFFFFFLE